MRWSSTGSGVVWARICVPDGPTTPTVPRLAARNPICSQSWRTKEATEVLPLVPVTATAVFRLRAEEARSDERKPAARVGVLDHGRAVERLPAALRHQDGGGATRQRVGDVARAVGARSGKCCEQVAGLHGAAVGGQSHDRNLQPGGGQRRLRPHQLTKGHHLTSATRRPIGSRYHATGSRNARNRRTSNRRRALSRQTWAGRREASAPRREWAQCAPRSCRRWAPHSRLPSLRCWFPARASARRA